MSRLHFPLRRYAATLTSNHIHFDIIQKTGIITLNRPQALNSLSLSMIRSIVPLISSCQNSCELLILTSSSPKAFCAGGDVIDVTTKLKFSPNQIDFFKEEYRMNNHLHKSKIPIVALINGITMGGGVGLSIHGKYVVGTEKTIFAMPETKIGLFPDVGGSWFLPRLPIPGLGTYLALTSYTLRSSDVFHSGLATHMVSSESLDSLKRDLIHNSNDVDRILNDYHNRFTLTSYSLQTNLENIQRHFESKDSLNDIIRSLESEKTNWSQKTLESLLNNSPTSLFITFRALQEGSKKESLEDCLKMELGIVDECLRNHDFYEGVRALLLDKDNSPKWKPSKLNQVTSIESYFTNSINLF